MKITKDDLISDVILEHPEAIEIFMSYGLGCAGCGGASFETIEEGASAHFMSDEDIDNLVKDLNEAGKEFSEF
ncbi:DUF1858 domain-containing protein [Candidatus Gracilibacteria bacterium]|nr:DUF1858 domain-containing protein [Candidatus Gracilibacteria bacterium]